ncbi:MAG TPA: polysaccharide biosynthesis/export family protein [Flavobacterium sp.]|jgi:polysaccharide export outer membrane protein
MNFTFAKYALIALLSVFFFSCNSRKNIVYLQDVGAGDGGTTRSFEPTIQPDDLLSIIVSAETPEVTMPFNLPQIQGNYQVGNNQNGIKTYLVDTNGNIEFPVIGTIKLGGLSRTEANNKLVAAVSAYIVNPSINLRILNYKISILGEVAKPGSFNVQSERLTILEALSLAGDLTVYGKRDNILIIRETEGKRSYNRVDITQSDFMNSPYYYLTQNDVVFVEPNQTRINSSVVGPNIQVIFSAVSLLVTIAVLIFR